MSQQVVYNFSELRTAALDASVDTVILGADIQMETGGILLPKNKAGLVIDGLFPQDETGTIHSIHDIVGNVHSNSIRVALETGAYNLTLKNCVYYGANFYGAISCVNGGAQASTVLTLENVEYSGPQSSYNRYGTVNIIGGSYRIGRYNGYTSAIHETVEAKTVRIGGDVSIFHEGTTNSCFYVSEAGASFQVLEGATVNIEATGRDLVYCDADIQVSVGDNAKLLVKSPRAFFYSASMDATVFSIGTDAEFVYDQTARHIGVATIQMAGNLSVASGARLILIRDFSATEPLIQFSRAATASFSDPDTVVLYNPAGRVISWSAGTGNINIAADTTSYWLSAADLSVAGTFADRPLYNWFKKDESAVTLSATVTTSATSSVSSNIIEEDAPVVPSTSTFNLQNARVLAFGRLPIVVTEPIRENDPDLRGTSAANAYLRATLDGVVTESQADGGGAFAIPMSDIKKHDEITVEANKEFKFKSKIVVALGAVWFLVVPERLPFLRLTSPIRQRICKRQNKDWEIIIRDSRENEPDWVLYADAPLPLTSGINKLENALHFDNEIDDVVVQGTTPVLIYRGTANQSTTYTDTHLSWNELKGFLLMLTINQRYASGHYETQMNFTIEEAVDDGLGGIAGNE